MLRKSLCYLYLIGALLISNQAYGGTWLTVQIDHISPASEEVLSDALKRVQTDQMDGLVIELDTPGGLLESTRGMVRDMLASPKPVIVWVGPAGAHAGSAGAFITLAASAAAMAPGTNIGAAHPVGVGGYDVPGGALGEKIINDASALMESIAQLRHRNPEVAISFVRNSLSLTAEEAHRQKVIDLIANNPLDVLHKLNGQSIPVGQTTALLDTQYPVLIPYEKTYRQRFLEILSNPDVFYLLFIAGLVGIGFELTHPGALAPGVLGGISLILALIASANLPVNFGAMLLLAASLAFMVAELFLPSFGILGIGGIIGFIIGSILLVDPNNIQGLRVTWIAVLPAAIAIALFILCVFYLVIRSTRSKHQGGVEAMIGQSAHVLGDFINGEGRVVIWGENWAARTLDGENCMKDDIVEIRAVDGLTLVVKPKT